MDDDAAISSALVSLNETQTLGRYELLAPIGRGGMAVVWAARLSGTRGFSKRVAVKTMLMHLAADRRFEQMFLKEAAIAAQIRHDNVCEILDLGEQDGVLYLVMEWVDGEPLATLLAPGDERLPVEVAAHLIADAARGLHAAHALTNEAGEPLGVVHRDVSPQNILVASSGVVKIVDFGVAKAALDGEKTTESGVIKGKVAYVAPEQINGAAVDARTDVFALGVVLYELTTGVHPFRGATDLATLLAIASTDGVTAPSVLDPTYPAELEKIVLSAIDKAPERRFATMQEMTVALDAFIEASGGFRSARDRLRDLLSARLSDRRHAQERRLKEAETAFDQRRLVRARSVPIPAKDRARRSHRGTLAIGIFVALAAGAGVLAGLRGGRGDAHTKAEAEVAPAAPPTEPSTGVADSASAPAPSIVASTSAIARQPAPRPRISTRSASSLALPSASSKDLPPPAAPPASGPRFREPGF